MRNNRRSLRISILRSIKVTELDRHSEAACTGLEDAGVLGGTSTGIANAALHAAVYAGDPASAGVMVSSIHFEYPIYLSSISSQRVFSAEP
jgi:hypothetical protein